MSLENVTAVIFDTYGTVVDWRTSVIAEGQALGERKGIEGVDWEAFTDAWKAAYRPYIDQVRNGERPWTTNDALQRQRLDEIIGTERQAASLQAVRSLHCRRCISSLESVFEPY